PLQRSRSAGPCRHRALLTAVAVGQAGELVRGEQVVDTPVGRSAADIGVLVDECVTDSPSFATAAAPDGSSDCELTTTNVGLARFVRQPPGKGEAFGHGPIRLLQTSRRSRRGR